MVRTQRNLFNTSALPELEQIARIDTPHDLAISGGALLKLVDENDPILRQPTEKWDFSRPEEEAQKLYLDLARTMRENGGIGLSANQVGLKHRVFVLESPYGFPMGVFNPVIISTSGEDIFLDEGCLSFPDLLLKVKRPSIIRLRFAEWSGEVQTRQFEGMSARAIQHELDHLDGKTFKERANKIHLEKGLRKRAEHRKLLKQHRV